MIDKEFHRLAAFADIKVMSTNKDVAYAKIMCRLLDRIEALEEELEAVKAAQFANDWEPGDIGTSGI